MGNTSTIITSCVVMALFTAVMPATIPRDPTSSSSSSPSQPPSATATPSPASTTVAAFEINHQVLSFADTVAQGLKRVTEIKFKQLLTSAFDENVVDVSMIASLSSKPLLPPTITADSKACKKQFVVEKLNNLVNEYKPLVDMFFTYAQQYPTDHETYVILGDNITSLYLKSLGDKITAMLNANGVQASTGSTTIPERNSLWNILTTLATLNTQVNVIIEVLADLMSCQ